MEQRRSNRAPLDAPAQVVARSSREDEIQMEHEPVLGTARDVSIGGMFIEMEAPFPFGTEVVVHVQFPGYKERFALPGRVRWTRADGMGLQFGLLGAKETHAITEIVGAAARG